MNATEYAYFTSIFQYMASMEVGLLLLIKTVFCVLGDHMAHSIRYGDVALSLLTGYSWDVRKQIESTQKLLDYDFLHVLPGHGRRYHLKDASDRLECITKSMEVAKLRI